MLHFSCPQCQKRFEIGDDSASGKETRCPQCGASFRIWPQNQRVFASYFDVDDDDDSPVIPPPVAYPSAPPVHVSYPVHYPVSGLNGLAVASLALGGVSLFLFCFWFAVLPTGILGIVLGCIARSQEPKGTTSSNLALAGILCGVVGLGIWLIVTIGLAVKLADVPRFRP